MGRKDTPRWGSISTATLSPRDLIPTFYETFEEYAPDRAHGLARQYPLLLSHEAGTVLRFPTGDEGHRDITRFAGFLIEQGISFNYFWADNSGVAKDTICVHEHVPYNSEAFDWEDIEDAELLSDLTDALNEIAQDVPFMRFGAHEGDGADFGFWFDRESFEEAARENTVVKVEAGLEWKMMPEEGIEEPADPQAKVVIRQEDSRWKTVMNSRDAEYVAEITDHGNITLYDLEGNEIWSLV